MILKKYAIVSLLIFFAQNIFSASLESIWIKNENGAKFIFFKMSANNNYRVYSLHNPERLVLDIDKITLSTKLQKFTLEDNLIQKIRYGHPLPSVLRVVLDLKQQVRFSSIKIKQAADVIIKIKLDSKAQGQSASAISSAQSAPQSISKATKLSSNSLKPSRPLRDVIVIIDPGHGGKDPGAIGIHHSYEKNIVLAIAKKLKILIDKQPGMRAVLTRNGDYYVGLRERMNIARKYNGDIFVAIHADAFGNHDSHGASVFALSASGATSEAARWLAEKENYSELGGVDLTSLDDKNGEIRTLLIDLSQTATISASLNMGQNVLKNLDKITVLHSKKVEQARFVVLKSPDIPSILIETGFISNPREEKNLTNSYYQTKLSQAIFGGIKAYFWNFPPYGSLIEAMIMKKRKIVRKSPLVEESKLG